jgi:GT2 family glycosyltransferase
MNSRSLLTTSSGAPHAEGNPSAEAGIAVSFLIVNYNMRPLVESCIAGVVRQMRESGLSYEILLGDNSSDPEFALTAGSLSGTPQVIFHKMEGAAGWIPALNRLIPEARGRLICIMHPDIEFGENCVRRCVEYMDAHPEAGVVAPNPYRSDDRPSNARVSFLTPLSEFKRILNVLCRLTLRRAPFREFRSWDHVADTAVDSVLSFCYFCRADLLREIGSIGGGLQSYYGNDYICMAAQRKGRRVLYLAGPRIVHYERRAPRAAFSGVEVMRYKTSPIIGGVGMERDRLRFIRHFYSPAAAAWIRALAVVGIAVEATVAWLKAGGATTEDTRAYWRICGIALRDPGARPAPLEHPVTKNG